MKIVKVFETSLKASLTTTATSITVRRFVDSNLSPVVLADFGAFLMVVLRQGNKIEIIRCTNVVQNANGSATLTIDTNGRNIPPKAPFTGSATGKAFVTGADVIVTNDPYTMSFFTQVGEDYTITGDWRFPTPSNGSNPATKDYADGLVASGVADASDILRGKSMMSVSPILSIGVATVTIATPAVVNFVAHGLQINDTIRFTTSGFLPTGLAPSVDYYVISAGFGVDSFRLSTTLGGAAINTSGTQSGVHTLYRSTPVALAENDPRVLTLQQIDNIPTTEEKSGIVQVGGDGSDGALNVASGTYTLDLNIKSVWNFTSVNIAVGAILNFSNGTAGDKVPVLKCQGNFTNAGTITTSGLGLPGGAGGAVSTAAGGTNGGTPTVPFVDTTIPEAGKKGSGAVTTTPGAGGAVANKNSTYFFPYALNGSSGAGGGGGTPANVGTPGAGGAGGAGSLGLIIEVIGNFVNTGTINLNGIAGGQGGNSAGNGSNSWSSGGGGGGGGGAAGSLVLRHKGTFSNTGSITVAGGAAGAGGPKTNTGGGGGSPVMGASGGGGSGGANSFNSTTAGGTGGAEAGPAGSAGANGVIFVEKVR